MTATDLIGLEGPEFEVDIERGKIREFARAMAAPLPEFMEGRNPVIPATFLVCAPYTWGYTLERPRGTVFASVGHNPTVSLHAEESFVFHGPPLRAGDRLLARAKLEDVKEKHGANGGAMTFHVTLIEYRDPGGVLRAEQRTTGVVTSASPGTDAWDYELPAYRAEYDGPDGRRYFDGVPRQGFSQLVEGEGPGSVSAGALMLQDIVRFQGVVGEDDPLHHDTDWARQCGYPSVFALGTHQASMLAAYAGHWLPPETVRSFRVRFRAVSWPGDRLVYSGRVLEKNEATESVRLHLTTTRENGELINEAWMDCSFRTL